MRLLLFILIAAIVHSADAQKKSIWWHDSTSIFLNNKVVDLIETNDGLMCLSTATDAKYQSPHFGHTTLNLKTLQPKYRIVNEVSNLYEVNKLLTEPDGTVRLYGSSKENGRISPAVHKVKADGSFKENTVSMVNTSHYLGDVIIAGKSDYIWAKSILGSQTGVWNSFVYRIDMEANERQVWRCKIESQFNEEAKKLVMLSDSSVVLLVKRYTDGSMKSFVPMLYRIDTGGAKIWQKDLQQYADVEDLNVSADAKSIYIIVSDGNESNQRNDGNITQFDYTGALIKTVHFENLNPKGLLVLKSGKLLVYGGYYTTGGHLYIKKGRAILLDKDLQTIKTSSLGEFDEPDSELPGLAASLQPSSSDFLTAIQLKDGRVALGGRVFMARDVAPDKIIQSERSNRNLLIISTEEGVW